MKPTGVLTVEASHHEIIVRRYHMVTNNLRPPSPKLVAERGWNAEAGEWSLGDQADKITDGEWEQRRNFITQSAFIARSATT